MTSPDILLDGPSDAALTLVLAHGAGAPMDSPFMARVAKSLGERGWRVARFEFPYMKARRLGARRGAPDRTAVLEESWLATIGALGGGAKLAIGGKSMGGRIASMVADQAAVRGLVCLGYPFHPPGKPEQLRTAHLADLKTPALFVQGERDVFGSREEIGGYALSPTIRLLYMPGGDHSFKPSAKSGQTEAGNLAAAVAVVSDFLQELARRRGPGA